MKNIRQVFSRFVFGFLAAGAILLTPHTAAAQMTWIIQNEQSEPVQAEFYSQNRNHAWPGAGIVVMLNDQRIYKYPIECNLGEKVCLGAWSKTSKKYWGVGFKNRHSCSNCCYECALNVTPREVLR